MQSETGQDLSNRGGRIPNITARIVNHSTLPSQSGHIHAREKGRRLCMMDNNSNDARILETHPHERSLGVAAFADLPAICISSTEWDFLFQRQQHLMRLFSRYSPVLFVDPLRQPSPLVFIRSVKPRLNQITPGLFSLSFPENPGNGQAAPDMMRKMRRISGTLSSKIPHFRLLNNLLTKRMVCSATKVLHINNHILWCYRYDSATFRRSKSKLVVYDCVDDWSAFGTTFHDVNSLERNLLAVSDIVFTSSRRLYEMKSRYNSHTYHVPNGVDFEHFSTAAKNPRRPAPLENISHPIMGFHGATYTWIDLVLIERIARRRPDWSFVFVGPVGGNVRTPRLPNMHFLGKVPYNVLPEYVASFDVCLLPFKRVELTQSVDPIKMYEYLAAGKPIVSTSIPEVHKFSDYAAIADDDMDFERAIASALTEDNASQAKARQEIASKNSWANRFKTMAKIIGDYREVKGI